jgi:thiol-disulfide isomerase/thioredoxin
MFTAAHCDKCRSLEPDLKRAAAHLSKEEPPIYIAKVDYKENEQIQERFPKIKKFPLFKMVRRGIPIDYPSPHFDFADIHNWAYKKVHPAVKPLSTQADLDDEIAKHEFVVMFVGDYTGKDNHLYNHVFEMIAKRYDKAFFGKLKIGSELEKLYHPAPKNLPTVVMFRDFEDNNVWFGKEFTHRNLERWIVRKSVPSLFTFS